MALINADALTLNAREAETMSEVIFKRVYNESDLAEYHEIETGIDVKTQIAFAGRLGLQRGPSRGLQEPPFKKRLLWQHACSNEAACGG